MAAFEIRSRMLVKDVMTSPVVTVDENSSADEAARLMRDNNIGCVIVSTRDGKPIGMITERDLVIRVVAENIQPNRVMAKDIMSAPLITINADKTISEAAREMNRHNIRRLAVMYKGQLVGIISSKDILSVTPELIEIIQERAKIAAGEEIEESLPLAGYCDNCGAWSDNLRETDGNYLCEDCYAEITRAEY
ncbi:MAG: CBS domain-containing protein [Candidatus Bathyarchaeia archaeon]|nr:CBS domain-containing protein [Candidatus Bathyarchaeota archaeon]